MESGLDRLLLLIILTDMALLATSRLRVAISLSALQGVLSGGLAIMVMPALPSLRSIMIALCGLALRGVLFPWLLLRIKRQADIREEQRPLVGPGASTLLGIAILASAIAMGARLPLHHQQPATLIVPATLFSIFTGVFLVIARGKAITQCIGYLALENGIYGFGVAVVGEVPALVELGALLDLFVAVLVMGVAMHRLSEEFGHMDTDRLTDLRG
ncbi:MAG: hydrogenase [Vicinamibacteria bacterium]|jgi:hydrogenase-4 component E|nr:hydrogenase [Vicinamibacteria bacterium]